MLKWRWEPYRPDSTHFLWAEQIDCVCQSRVDREGAAEHSLGFYSGEERSSIR